MKLRHVLSQILDAITRRRYVVPSRLYSADGKRCVEIRVRTGGRTFFVEQIHISGTKFEDRSPSREVGPFESPEAAELAAVAKGWFSTGQD